MRLVLLCKAVLIPASMAALLVVAVIHADGVPGLRPFLCVEGLMLVIGGTFLLAWTAYPAREIIRALVAGVNSDGRLIGEQRLRCLAILEYCSACALSMGWLSAALGLTLGLHDYGDPAGLAARSAYALAGLVTGLFVSKVVLGPLAQRLKGSTSQDR